MPAALIQDGSDAPAIGSCSWQPTWAQTRQVAWVHEDLTLSITRLRPEGG
jgi:hypothetical protein